MAVIKNEAALIGEWLAFHAEVGFTKLIVYNNRSDDNSIEIVQRASNTLNVELIDWPYTCSDYQVDAYSDAINRADGELDWIALIDADEFILPLRDKSIGAFLTGIVDADAVVINWAMFGSSGWADSPKGLVTENYLNRAADGFSVNRHTKMILRPSSFSKMINPHFARIDGAYVDVLGKPVLWSEPGLTVKASGIEILRVNHYFTRAKSDWIRKVARGYNNDRRNIDDFDTYDRNEVYDNRAAKIGKIIREKYPFLEAQPPSRMPLIDSPLPRDFDPSTYLRLHQDVARSEMDPVEHYLNFGKQEGRVYRQS